jgi:hypothetical protein
MKKQKYIVKYFLIVPVFLIVLMSLYQRNFSLYINYSGCDFGTCSEKVSSDDGPIVMHALGFPTPFYGVGYFTDGGQRVTTYDPNCVSGDCVSAPIDINKHYLSHKPVQIANSSVYSVPDIDMGFNSDHFLLDVVFWIIVSAIFYPLSLLFRKKLQNKSKA